MKTIEEIKREFDTTTDEKIRKNLRDRYISLLPDREKIAVRCFSLFCTNKTKIENFNSGVHGLEDDWDEPTHKEYLERADRLLEKFDGDCDDLMMVMLNNYAMGYREP